MNVLRAVVLGSLAVACRSSDAVPLVEPTELAHGATPAEHRSSAMSAAEAPPVADVRPLNSAPSESKRLAQQVLLPDEEPPYWAMVRPSWERWVAVALTWPEPEYDENDTPLVDENAPWTLVVTSMRQPNWNDPTFDASAGRAELERRGIDFDVERRSMPLDARTAEKLLGAWRTIVRRARNPPPVFVTDDAGRECELGPGIHADGTTYDFRADEFFGTTWSPQPGPAADLVALVTDLATLVRANPTDLDAQLRALGDRARELDLRTRALRW